VLERRPNNQRNRVSEEDALGVVLIVAATFGVLVSVRTLLLAWLTRDRILALIAVAALVMFGIAVLVAAEGIL
jgi:hypothetical protein